MYTYTCIHTYIHTYIHNEGEEDEQDKREVAHSPEAEHQEKQRQLRERNQKVPGEPRRGGGRGQGERG